MPLHTPTFITRFLITPKIHGIYKPAAKRAAPPSNALKPIAPVGIAPAAPAAEVLLEGDAVAELAIVVVALMPDVKGATDAEEAPLKAADVVVGLGVAIVLFGLRTLSITWTTPPAMSTFGVITLAELTKTLPSSIVIVTFAPLTVVKVVLLSNVL